MSTFNYGLRVKLDSTCIVNSSLLVIVNIWVVGTGFLVTAHRPKSNLCVLNLILGFLTLARSLMLNLGPEIISNSTSDLLNEVSFG